uniref:Nudix hydrolase domain-containing protein n=1 Tax=viral metagenome TaxID=1070528 RepID=A0A6C0KMU0_9ZZZZ
MGASILPVTIHNNKIYFLFGKERDIDENPGWSDFGGGTEKGESFFQTAIREGSEELTGFLGNSIQIKDLLKEYGTYIIDYKSNGHSTYRCHIFPIQYDDKLPFYYNNNQQFLQKKLDPKIIIETKIFEKTQIEWFSFHDIKKRQNEFRSFYKNIIELILGNKIYIETFVKKSFRKKTKPSFKRYYNNNKKTRKNRLE